MGTGDEKLMKNIGIIGQGFVGTAIRDGLVHAFEVVTYDKKYPDPTVRVWPKKQTVVHYSFLHGKFHVNASLISPAFIIFVI